MSKYLKCDRCGKFLKVMIDPKLRFEYSNEGWTKAGFAGKAGDDLGYIHDFDVCPECVDEVNKFMKGGED